MTLLFHKNISFLWREPRPCKNESVDSLSCTNFIEDLFYYETYMGDLYTQKKKKQFNNIVLEIPIISLKYCEFVLLYLQIY